MVQQLNIKEINAINKLKFMTVFGNVVEKCPQAVLHLLTLRPYTNTYEMLLSLEQFFDSRTTTGKIQILRQYPELTAPKKSLTEESLNEQTNSGLFSLREHTQSTFADLNTQYRFKFGFPFVMCVAGYDPHCIVSSFEERLESDFESEINTGIIEVKKISRHRLSDLIID